MIILCEFYFKTEQSPIGNCTISWRSIPCSCSGNQVHCDSYDFLKEKENE